MKDFFVDFFYIDWVSIKNIGFIIVEFFWVMFYKFLSIVINLFC